MHSSFVKISGFNEHFQFVRIFANNFIPDTAAQVPDGRFPDIQHQPKANYSLLKALEPRVSLFPGLWAHARRRGREQRPQNTQHLINRHSRHFSDSQSVKPLDCFAWNLYSFFGIELE
jgi:hypothetical protein